MTFGKVVAQQSEQYLRKLALARRVTLIGMAVSGILSAAKLLAGWIGHSTAVFADGLENGGDVFGSGLILHFLYVASIPPDKEQPYGHGRSETIAGLTEHTPTHAPQLFAIWPMVASIIVKGALATGKFTYGKRLGSMAIQADAWHDGIEIFSGFVALIALALSLYNQEHFAAADHDGGFIVGLIVLLTAFHVVRDSSQDLMDAMPDDARIAQIRGIASAVPGISGVEKTYARKTGLEYHVELHLEVDPRMTVQDSHTLATDTRFLIRKKLDWIADVVVHVEPFTGAPRNQ
jgi:divalent metal cation (Fe/Co/Zn/Cd) transporter